MTNKYSYMHFVGYKSIPNWSAGYILGHDLGFSEKYPLARIGDFIRPAKNAVVVADDKEYKQVTLKTNGGGAVLRGVMKGCFIGTKKQFLAKSGQFVMSKIDARNGAFGIISKELNGAIVTGDFPLFDVNSDLISTEYLFLISTTKSFVRFAQSCSRGTTNRRRIDVNLFLQQQIPLPSLEEQKTLVDAYKEKMYKANKYEAMAVNSLMRIDNHIRETLGFSISMPSFNKGLCFVNFQDVSRWDYSFFQSQKHMKSLYALVPIGNCVCNFMIDKNGKSLRRETFKTPNKRFRYIGMENVVKNEGVLVNPHIVNGRDIKSQTIAVPQGYLIYGKLRPYLNKYWINNIEGSDIVCSSEFFVFDVNSEINKQYFELVLSSSIIQDQICNVTSGARMPRINEGTFLELQIPMPSIDIQSRIVNDILLKRGEINSCREQAAKLRQDAIAQFEQAIFK